MKRGVFFRRGFIVLGDHRKYGILRFLVRFRGLNKDYLFFFFFRSLSYFYSGKTIFIRLLPFYTGSVVVGICSFFFFLRFFFFRVFKAHGINMRITRASSFMFFRVGTSHGLYIKMPQSLALRVFKKRYFLLFGYNKRVVDFFSYHFRFFRRFFGYKLIGIKYLRDSFKIKVGKKKSF